MILKRSNPRSRASRQRARMRSSEYPSHPTDVVYAGYPCSIRYRSRSARVGTRRSSVRMASAGVSASVKYRQSTSSTICPGLISERSFHNGLPAIFAQRSQSALTTAAVAMWMTPFSGPSHRSWLSPVSRFQNSPGAAANSATVHPTTSGRRASTPATTTSVPRPIVNARPSPVIPSPRSVFRMT